jgi:uncharacterized membrane protein
MFISGSNITCFTFYIHLWPIHWLYLVVQGFHWKNAQATIIPSVEDYSQNEIIIFFVTSGCLKHVTVAVNSYKSELCNFLSGKLKHLTKIYYFYYGELVMGHISVVTKTTIQQTLLQYRFVLSGLNYMCGNKRKGLCAVCLKRFSSKRKIVLL